MVPMIAAPRRLSPPGEAGGAVAPLRRRRAGGTGRRWRGARGGAARPESAATWRGMMRSRRWMGARGPLNEGMRTRSGPSSYRHHPPAAARPAGKKTRIGDFSVFSRDSASISSSQIPEATRGCDLRGAENRGRSTCYASYVDEPVMMVTGSGTKHYFHQNHLYSVAAMTNSAGAVVERYRYDAYGKRTVTNAAGMSIAASAIGQQRGFTGYHEDAETGLCYARNRMYSTGLGRFVSRDNFTASDVGPSAEDGYFNGYSLYSAYFAPNGLDPSGQYTSQWGLTDCILYSSTWIDEPSVSVDVTAVGRPKSGAFDPTVSWAGIKYFKLTVVMDVTVTFNVNCEYWCRGCANDGTYYPNYTYDGDEVIGPGIVTRNIRVPVRLPAIPWPIPANWKWAKLLVATAAAGSTADFLNDVANVGISATAGFKAVVSEHGPEKICKDGMQPLIDKVNAYAELLQLTEMQMD